MQGTNILKSIPANDIYIFSRTQGFLVVTSLRRLLFTSVDDVISVVSLTSGVVIQDDVGSGSVELESTSVVLFEMMVLNLMLNDSVG